MYLKKPCNRVDRKGLCNTLRVYGVGGQLLKGIRSFYENASASVRVNGELTWLRYFGEMVSPRAIGQPASVECSVMPAGVLSGSRQAVSLLASANVAGLFYALA